MLWRDFFPLRGQDEDLRGFVQVNFVIFVGLTIPVSHCSEEKVSSSRWHPADLNGRAVFNETSHQRTIKRRIYYHRPVVKSLHSCEAVNMFAAFFFWVNGQTYELRPDLWRLW